MDKRQWITKQDLLDMIAMGKISPGLMVANISMMFGYSVAGVFGGVCAVCGMSMIPLILQEMVSHQWMTTEDMSNLIAIAEMTPGPLGLNCATFAGTRTAGPLGGAVAVFGVLTPAFTAALLIAVFYQKMKNSQVMETILSVIRPICVGMLMEIVWNLTGENYICETGIDWKACMIGVMAAYLLIRRKWEVPGIIAIAEISGIAIWYVL